MSMRGKFVTWRESTARANRRTSSSCGFIGARGQHVVVTREPGGTDLASTAQAHPAAFDAPVAETLLLLAARADTWPVSSCRRWARATGWSVTASRRHRRLQGAGKGVSLSDRAALPAVHPGFGPDRTLVSDWHLRVARQRLAAFWKRSDRFEREDAPFSSA